MIHFSPGHQSALGTAREIDFHGKHLVQYNRASDEHPFASGAFRRLRGTRFETTRIYDLGLLLDGVYQNMESEASFMLSGMSITDGCVALIDLVESQRVHQCAFLFLL